MLWDNDGLALVELITQKRRLALALTTSSCLVRKLRDAIEIAGFDLVAVKDVERCTAAISMEKPDIVFLDLRLVDYTAEFKNRLAEARVTETLPILPIRPHICHDTRSMSLTPQSPKSEIFLKTRALLRRERPVALKGKRHNGPFVLDEPRFKLNYADKSADLSKPELCLLGPFFDVDEVVLDRRSLEILAFLQNDRKVGSRIVDFQISRMRRRLNSQLGTDPLRSVRGVGYTLART